MKTFTAEVDAWISESEEALEAVFKESVKRVSDVMQKPLAKGGNMPVDTGLLRNSYDVTINAPSTKTVSQGQASTATGTNYALVINGAKLGDTIFGIYTADYASYVNFGSNGRQGRQFVGLAAQQWPQIVNGVVRDLGR